MKKKFTYLLLAAIFIGLTAFVAIRYNSSTASKPGYYKLKDRVGPSASLPEWQSVKQNGDKLFKTVAAKPDDLKSTIALASLYIQEARVTGDYNYYDAAAMKYIDDVLAQNPNYFDALILKAILQLSQHHFTDALETATVAQKVNPYNSFVYGIMVDGNVEMGNYEKAVTFSDKMMSVRPDMRSYARVAYLREIYGDYPGAIEAMTMAVDAGGAGDEGTEWSRIQLARLYENTGDLPNAEMHYTIALRERPGFGYALAGLGSIATGKGDYQRALGLYQQADSAINDYAIKEKIAELYVLMGDKKHADEEVATIIGDLTKLSSGGEATINHHTDKELAYVYLLSGENAKAVTHATNEYNRRPDNIDVNEALAWALYRNGDLARSKTHIEKALITNSQNPVLRLRAGLILIANGENAKGRDMITKVLSTKPNIDPSLLKEASSAVGTI